MPDEPLLTTSNGSPVADDQHSLSVGDHGPLLLQDYQLIEKLAHFTASASRSGSCTPRGRAPTATSNSAAT